MPFSESKGEQSFEVNGKTFATQDNLGESPIYRRIVIDKASGFVPSSQTFSILNTSSRSSFKALDLSSVVGSNEAFVMLSVSLSANSSGVHAISVQPFGASKSSSATTQKLSGEELTGGISTIYISDDGEGGSLSSVTNQNGIIEFFMPRIGVDILMVGYIPMIE